MKKAWDNEDSQDEIRKEVSRVVADFLSNRQYQDHKVSKAIRDELFAIAEDLAIMRAPGMFNSYDGDIVTDVTPEVPTRLVQQFKRLFSALKSLDKDYPDEEALAIIRHIAKGSGDEYRRRVRDYMRDNPDGKKSLTQIARACKMGKNTTKQRLNALWSLGFVNKELEEIRNRDDQLIKEVEWWEWNSRQTKL